MRRREVLAILGGAAVGWPFAALGQQTAKTYRIAYLSLLPDEYTILAKTLLQRLDELGYIEGKNFTFDYRTAANRPDRLPELAAEIVRASPDVLITGFGTLTAKAAKAATATIPVVFTGVADPIGAGLVVSLNRPGGNLTGISGQAPHIVGKRLQILLELIPANRIVAVLLNPDTPASTLVLSELRSAARQLNQRLEVFEARTVPEIGTSIEAAIQKDAAGLFTIDDPLTLGLRGQIADRAAKARLPTIFSSRYFVEAGGLMSFGTDRRQLNRRAAELVDKILKGANPADQPVEQPTKFELVLNLKTATALGLTVPQSLLQRADEVIE
jgi:putative ABC transport system substrate-binding protein